MINAMGAAAIAGAPDPFACEASLISNSVGELRLDVCFRPQKGAYLYYSEIAVAGPDGAPLPPKKTPVPAEKFDPFLGTNVLVVSGEVRFEFGVPSDAALPYSFTVSYQGCNENSCFLPIAKKFSLRPGESSSGVATDGSDIHQAAGGGRWRDLLSRFRVSGRASGFLSPAELLDFLDQAEGRRPAGGDIADRLRSGGILWAIIAILAGGLALNLTPCVLPMIPINIAILAGGMEGRSRLQGFALGLAYGTGMAAAYGALGLMTVLGGVRFGTLNSSPVFNAAVAVLFAVLALSMFGFFTIDLSRYQGRISGLSGGRLGGAFAMGAVAALLAGACVAPVVISVLLLAAQLYAAGNRLAFAIPFILGLGMALPWPFAGAGLSFLPRPGRWMNLIKIGFGVVILGFGVYYGAQAVHLARERNAVQGRASEDAEEEGFWSRSLEPAMEEALDTRKPLFVDFWASWCKSCSAMDARTFKSPDVRRRLDGYVRLKYQAENPSDAGTKEVLDAFGVTVGLPTFVVLVPERDR